MYIYHVHIFISELSVLASCSPWIHFFLFGVPQQILLVLYCNIYIYRLNCPMLPTRLCVHLFLFSFQEKCLKDKKTAETVKPKRCVDWTGWCSIERQRQRDPLNTYLLGINTELKCSVLVSFYWLFLFLNSHSSILGLDYASSDESDS